MEILTFPQKSTDFSDWSFRHCLAQKAFSTIEILVPPPITTFHRDFHTFVQNVSNVLPLGGKSSKQKKYQLSIRKEGGK